MKSIDRNNRNWSFRQPIRQKARETFGDLIRLLTPVVFGGSTEESSNMAIVDQAVHAQLCVYWNRIYARVRATGNGG